MLNSLESLGGHLLVLVLIWVALMVVSTIVKVAYKRSVNTVKPETNEGGELTDKWLDEMSKLIRIIRIAGTAGVLIAAVILVLFNFSWGANNPGEGPSVTTQEVDESYKPPTKEEIKEKNEKSSDVEASKKKEDEAEKDNDKAMKDALNLFKTEKEAK